MRRYDNDIFNMYGLTVQGSEIIRRGHVLNVYTRKGRDRHPVVIFRHDKKLISLSVARLIYAHYFGPVEFNEVVVPKDGNPDNWEPSNLEKIRKSDHLLNILLNKIREDMI